MPLPFTRLLSKDPGVTNEARLGDLCLMFATSALLIMLAEFLGLFPAADPIIDGGSTYKIMQYARALLFLGVIVTTIFGLVYLVGKAVRKGASWMPVIAFLTLLAVVISAVEYIEVDNQFVWLTILTVVLMGVRHILKMQGNK